MTVYKVLIPHNGRKGWVDLDTSTTIERIKADALVRAGYLRAEVTEDATTGAAAVPAEPRTAAGGDRLPPRRRKKATDVPEVTDDDVEAEPSGDTPDVES